MGTLSSREEVPHIRGQGQKPGGPHARRVAAKRSYPASEVKGDGREEKPHVPSPRPGVVGRKSYPTPLRPRPRAAAGRSNPMTKARGGDPEDQPHLQGAVAAWEQEGLEELSHVEGQEGQR